MSGFCVRGANCDCAWRSSTCMFYKDDAMVADERMDNGNALGAGGQKIVTNTPRAGEAPGARDRKEKENVTLPNHYARFKIEPITFICENKLDFFQGNIVKYVCRHDAKNGIEDLRKAKRYLEMYIKYLQDDPTWPAK